MLAMVARAYSPKAWEAEIGGCLIGIFQANERLCLENKADSTMTLEVLF